MTTTPLMASPPPPGGAPPADPGPVPELAPARERSWQLAVHEGLRVLGLVTQVILIPFCFTPMVGEPALDHSLSRTGFWLLLATEALCTLALLLRWYNRKLLALLGAGLLASMALIVPFRDEFTPSDLYCPGWWAIPVLALAMVVLPLRSHRRYLLPAVPVVLAVELSGLFFWPLNAIRATDEVFVVQPVVILYLFGGGLLQMAREHDHAQERLQALRASHAAEREEQEGRREAARLLHDHVLHALHAVSQQRHLVPAEEAVRECRNTTEQLERPTTSTRLVQLADVLLDDPVVTRVAGGVRGEVKPLPAAVASALAAASHEALVNVERHAQATSCSLLLEGDGGDGCRVTITDDGRGFDLAGQPSGRLGLQHSVVERLADIDGLAEVSSGIGQGTTVRLVWPHDAPADAAPQLAGHTDVRTRRMLAVIAWPGMLSTLLLMALLAPQLPGSGPLVLLTLAAVGLGMRNSLRLPEHGLGVGASVLMVGTALVAWLVNVWTVDPMPTSQVSIYFLWMAWGATAVMQLAMLARPNRVAMAMSLSMPVLLVAPLLVRFGVGYTVTNLLGSVAATATIIILGYSAMLMAQRIASQSEAQARRVERVRDANTRIRRLVRVESYWSQRVNQDALPLIHAVADGQVDPANDQVRRTARAMESSVRDELLLGPGRHGYGEELMRLREQGWQVHSSLAGGDGPLVLAAAARLARALGSAAAPEQLVTLSTAAGTAVAVVLDATDEQIERWHRTVPDLGGHMEHDPDFVRIQAVAR